MFYPISRQHTVEPCCDEEQAIQQFQEGLLNGKSVAITPYLLQRGSLQKRILTLGGEVPSPLFISMLRKVFQRKITDFAVAKAYVQVNTRLLCCVAPKIKQDVINALFFPKQNVLATLLYSTFSREES